MTRRQRGRHVIAVTGVDTGLGALVHERLAARPGGVRAVAVVNRRALAGVGTVVHLDTTYDVAADPVQRRRRNVDGTRRLLETARASGVARVVLVTSADVYGADADRPLPIRDDAPLRAEPDDGLLGDHVEVERLAAHAVRTGLSTAVLRPVTLVGGRLGSTYDGYLVRQLAGPRLLAIRGVEPLWQLCHVEDLAAAVEVVATTDLAGGMAVGCEGFLPQSRVEAIAGKRRVVLPAGVAVGTAERLHQLGLTTSSPRELDQLLAPVVVAATTLRDAGWQPSWTNEAALRAHVEEREIGATDSRAGAYTAAGATVALLGTAALVRQARRRRGRG
jgi:nucleoside-diphosphate-sugar epimerase